MAGTPLERGKHLVSSQKDMALLHNLVLSVLACSVSQVLIFARLLLHGLDGKLMTCLLPPCQRGYTLWFALSVFAFIAATSCYILASLSRPSMSFPSNAIIFGTIGIAVANFAIDCHYAHPIPHGGVSLHWSMHSDVGTAEQALLPFVSVILSITTMVLNVVCHRALADRSQTSRGKEA